MKPTNFGPFMEYAESIKANPKISKNWKKKLLAINQTFINELREYDEAIEILRGSQHRLDQLQEKVNKGKISSKEYLEYLLKICHAKQRADNFESFREKVLKSLERIEGQKS